MPVTPVLVILLNIGTWKIYAAVGPMYTCMVHTNIGACVCIGRVFAFGAQSKFGCVDRIAKISQLELCIQ